MFYYFNYYCVNVFLYIINFWLYWNVAGGVVNMNKEQKWYFNSALKFSVFPLLLMLLLPFFDSTREYVGMVILVFASMWAITFICILIFAGYTDRQIEKLNKNE